MPLINIVLALIVVAVLFGLINRYVSMAASIKTILNVIVVVAVGVWALQRTGLWTTVTNFRIGRSRPSALSFESRVSAWLVSGR
jgi:hypothetical protein